MAVSAPGREEGARSLQARVFLLVAATFSTIYLTQPVGVKDRSLHRPADPVPCR